MKIHEKYLKRCLQLAENGLVMASPNPSVGCVIVVDKQIIGEGYTSPYGGNHAEVNAIESVSDKTMLTKATLYVSLEPCNHYGKTPPCSDLILSHGIPTIVVGCVDPNEKVSGKGIAKLEAAGCRVIVDVLKKESQELNRRFFTFHKTKRPYIILKWAQTRDGYIDKIRKAGDLKKPNWISSLYSQQLVHKWRSEEQAILVGTKTAINDNPKLNVRLFKGKNPIRIFIDRDLKVPSKNHLLDKSVPTIVCTAKEQKSEKNLIYEQIDFSKNLASEICKMGYEHNIQSMIIEGGKRTLQTFVDANLWDEARIFEANGIFKEGLRAPVIKGKEIVNRKMNADTLRILKNSNC